MSNGDVDVDANDDIHIEMFVLLRNDVFFRSFFENHVTGIAKGVTYCAKNAYESAKVEMKVAKRRFWNSKMIVSEFKSADWES